MFKSILRFILKLFGFKKYDVKDDGPKPEVQHPVVEKQEHFLLTEEAKKPVRKPRITANKSKGGAKVTESKSGRGKKAK